MGPSGVSQWVLDSESSPESGCKTYLIFDRSVLTKYELISRVDAKMGTKAKEDLAGCGNVDEKVLVASKRSYCRLQNVLHIPTLEYYSISVPTIYRNGIRTSSETGRCETVRKNTTAGTGPTWLFEYYLYPKT